MANRTMQILGQGFGASPAEIAVSVGGNIVFSGTVSTINQPIPQLPDLSLTNSTVVLCDFEIDTSFSGQLPMTCQVVSGTVIFAQIYADYVSVPNPVFNTEQRAALKNPATSPNDRIAIYNQVASPAMTQTDIDTLLDPSASITVKEAILKAHNCLLNISSGPDTFLPMSSSDPRINVTIDGVAQTPDRVDLSGVWWWTVNAGSTFAYNLEVTPAIV